MVADHSHRYVKEATYHYTDEAGAVLYRKIKKRCACGAKTFVNQRRVSGSVFVNGLGNVRKVPYNLPAVIRAIWSGDAVWIVEGEKDVEALRERGEVATCSPDGAKSWDLSYAKLLYGAAEVRIVADKDTPGRKYADEVRASLAGHVERTVKCGVPEAEDISHHFATGGRLASLLGGAPQTGIAKGLAKQFAAAAARPGDPELPGVDEYPIPSEWPRIVHEAEAATRARILNAQTVNEGDVVDATLTPVRCGGCGGFLQVEMKPGAGRVCWRCRVTYETRSIAEVTV